VDEEEPVRDSFEFLVSGFQFAASAQAEIGNQKRETRNQKRHLGQIIRRPGALLRCAEIKSGHSVADIRIKMYACAQVSLVCCIEGCASE
jgi:hypothetical protein